MRTWDISSVLLGIKVIALRSTKSDVWGVRHWRSSKLGAGLRVEESRDMDERISSHLGGLSEHYELN